MSDSSAILPLHGNLPAIYEQKIASPAAISPSSESSFSPRSSFSPSPRSDASSSSISTPDHSPTNPAVFSAAHEFAESHDPEFYGASDGLSCVSCYRLKQKCDRKRPCSRCIEHNRAKRCRNRPKTAISSSNTNAKTTKAKPAKTTKTRKSQRESPAAVAAAHHTEALAHAHAHAQPYTYPHTQFLSLSPLSLTAIANFPDRPFRTGLPLIGDRGYSVQQRLL